MKFNIFFISTLFESHSHVPSFFFIYIHLFHNIQKIFDAKPPQRLSTYVPIYLHFEIDLCIKIQEKFTSSRSPDSMRSADLEGGGGVKFLKLLISGPAHEIVDSL